MFRTRGTLAGLVISFGISPVNAMQQMVETSFGAGLGVQDLYSELSNNGGISYEPTGFNFQSNNSKAEGIGKIEIKP
jgi:hypothetical protein